MKVKLKQFIQMLKSVQVWGGEDNTAVYGKVYISINLLIILLTETTKSDIITQLKILTLQV